MSTQRTYTRNNSNGQNRRYNLMMDRVQNGTIQGRTLTTIARRAGRIKDLRSRLMKREITIDEYNYLVSKLKSESGKINTIPVKGADIHTKPTGIFDESIYDDVHVKDDSVDDVNNDIDDDDTIDDNNDDIKIPISFGKEEEHLVVVKGVDESSDEYEEEEDMYDDDIDDNNAIDDDTIIPTFGITERDNKNEPITSIQPSSTTQQQALDDLSILDLTTTLFNIIYPVTTVYQTTADESAFPLTQGTWKLIDVVITEDTEDKVYVYERTK